MRAATRENKPQAPVAPLPGMVLRTTRLTTVGSDVYMRGVVVPADAPGMTAAGRGRLLAGRCVASCTHDTHPSAARAPRAARPPRCRAQR